MLTIKLPYKTDQLDLILQFQQNQSNIVRFIYNRLVDSNNKLSQKDLTELTEESPYALASG